MGSPRLLQGDFTHVDLDQKGLGHELVVPFIGVDPAFGREDNPTHIPIVRGVVEPGCSTENVHRVVVAP